MIDQNHSARVARHSGGRVSRRAKLGESLAPLVRTAKPPAEVTARDASQRYRASAFTLIEMLVSLAITLIMMGAVVTLFGTISDSVSGSRSIIEISERLRAARNRLQADLQGATATMKPPLRPENDEGYLEIIEGPMRDSNYLVVTPPPLANPIPPEYLQTALGDVDDVLMFTVRSRGEPFVGKFNATTTESQIAEVIYFCAPASDSAGAPTDSVLYLNAGTPVRTYTLYRRVLLVNPGLSQAPSFITIAPNSTYYDLYDISARPTQDQNGQPKMVANSLGDLTKREFRYAHVGTAFPAVFPFDVMISLPNAHPLRNPSVLQHGALGAFSGQRLGDDVLLTNVLSFDVQVYDPGAPVQVTATAALAPTDPGYGAGGTVNGAYVDLGSINYTGGQFNNRDNESNTLSSSGQSLRTVIPTSAVGSARFLSPPVGSPAHTYDTWSMHYENNGVNENPTHAADTSTNGLDDDGNGIVDDPVIVSATGQITGGEADTIPPYAAQLRGLRVTIRVYEPSSQQVRQITVVGDFLPD